MQFSFSFKHMSSSEALAKYAEAKIQDKIKKFATKPIEAHITFSIEKQDKSVQCHLTGGDGFNILVSHTSQDMHTSIDLLIDKLETQLKKTKEKLKAHKGKPRSNTALRLVGAKETPKSSDSEPIDAEDLIKYERARQRAFGGR